MSISSFILTVGVLSFAVGHVHSVGTYKRLPGYFIHSTASTNYLWAINAQYQVFRCNRPCTGRWVRVSGISLKQIDASDDEVWGVNRHNRVYKRPVDGSGQWRRVDGLFKHVSASGNGYIWAVNLQDRTSKCKKPCNGAWQIVDGRLKQIDGGEKYVYGVNNVNYVYARPVDGSGTWRLIPGQRLKHVTASGADNIYGVDSQGGVYSCPKPCVGEFMLLDGSLSQLDGTLDSFVGVNSSRHIFVRKTGL